MGERLVTLFSRDGRKFEIDFDVATFSYRFRAMFVDLLPHETLDALLIDEVDGKILDLIIRWAEYHKNDAEIPKEMPDWDIKFLLHDEETLRAVMYAAKYLDIPRLYRYSSIMLTVRLGRTDDEIMDVFGIEKD